MLFVFIALIAIVSCQLVQDIKEVKDYIQELYVNEAQLEDLIQTSAKETKDECRRMTDTVVDFVINERWN